MPLLTIRHHRRFYEPRLPHLLFIDGLYAGTMQGDEARIEVPRGSYDVKVQFGGLIPVGKRKLDLSVSASLAAVSVQHDTVLIYRDRERLWNLLFDIDLLVWVASLFVKLPPIYHILSDAFFVLWLLRLVLFRKRYYKLTLVPPEEK